MMSKNLTVVKTAERKIKKRESIVLIETMPEDDWFVSATTSRGREIWYLRFKVTGMSHRLYGPFKSKHQCLLFLDEAINALADFDQEIQDACDKRMLKETCQKVWPPIIEYPVQAQLHSSSKKGS